jgi:hypothetical protein
MNCANGQPSQIPDLLLGHNAQPLSEKGHTRYLVILGGCRPSTGIHRFVKLGFQDVDYFINGNIVYEQGLCFCVGLDDHDLAPMLSPERRI